MVLVLALCIKKNTISSVIVSTYQSITEQELYKQQLENEYAGVQVNGIQIPNSYAIPQCDSFEENGYTKEEMKLVVRLKNIR
jgi:aspartate-semialdehyde dehydrogenase